DFPKQARQALSLPDNGVVVFEVAPGGPAAEAGITGPAYEASIGGEAYPAGGDIIVKVDGEEVETISDLQRRVLDSEEGDVLTLEVWRNGATRTVELTFRVVEEGASGG